MEPGTGYDFTVPQEELRFFDGATELRIRPRTL
jgi:hypothetical protein